MTRRILHAVGGMGRGGVESWLMHVLRRADPQRYQMDFLVRTTREQAHDPEIRALGGRVIPCEDHARPWRFARRFGEVMRSHGPYDVVHSHLPHYSGFLLRLAARHEVPVRIVHSHNDTRIADAARSRLWRGYARLMRSWIWRYATVRLAASRVAAESLFGPDWRRDERSRILYCGIDLHEFEPDQSPAETRSMLGLPADALVIGHAGRFAWQKNHAYLLRVAAAAMQKVPRTWVLLVGDGPLRGEMEQLTQSLGIADRVVFAGSRGDVPRLMTGAMDVLLFPSHHEGLSIVLLEAQAAGLPCVLSEGLAEEGDAVPELITRLPLDAPLEQWVAVTMDVAGRRPLRPQQALDRMRQSDFDVERSAAELFRLYDQGAR
jgi:glycosyltransferase involved in cell wall biosynthesis